MKLYLCGPITGLPNGNKKAFAQAAETLRKLGAEVVNPHEVCADITANHTGTAEELWLKCMRKAVAAMLECDVVAVLNGWEGSRGAGIEMELARRLGIEIIVFETAVRWLSGQMPHRPKPAPSESTRHQPQ